MKASELCSGLHPLLILRLTVFRSIRSRLPPPPRTKAKTYTSQIWKSTSPQTVSCEWTWLLFAPDEKFNLPIVREQTSLLPMVGGTVSSVVTVSLISGGFLCNFTSVNLGVGKSTLLRHIAMREVPIPPHITILFVEQEVRITSLVSAARLHDLSDRWG